MKLAGFRIEQDSGIISRFAAFRRCRTTEAGKVAEWSNALDSKSSVLVSSTVSSNLTLSANDSKTYAIVKDRLVRSFHLLHWFAALIAVGL